MKTKHILTAMALPALFAACTADDIVSENNGLQQDQRAKLSEDFVLNVNNEVESRYAVEGSTELKFVFAEGDKIGANLIDIYADRTDDDLVFDKKDPATWEIVNTIAPALPFIYEGGVWKSANEDLGIGNYLFTNPFNPADKNRAAASYELPVVVHYSSENPNAHIEAYNKAVAAQITYEGQTSANADLKNIFAYPMIRINFDKNLDVKKVTKVVLAKCYTTTVYNEETRKDETIVVNSDPFVYKGAFNHKDMADMFNPKNIKKWLEDNKASKVTEDDYWAQFQTSHFIIDKADYNERIDIEDVIEDTKDYAEIKTTPYFIYEMDETVVANSIDVRFMIPSIETLEETVIKNTRSDERITMYVCTDKGNFEMELTDLNNYQFSNTTLAALKNAAMQRNTSYTLKTKASALVDSPNASIFFNNIVSTAADWNKLVEEYGDLRKYSAEYNKVNASGEKVNKDAQEMIVNIISDKFALTSDLKMPEVAEFIIQSNVNVEGEVALKNIKVTTGNKLIVKDGAVLTTDPTLNAASVEVEKGGELVFAAEYNDKEELVAYTKMTTVHNHGTVTVPAGVIAQFTLQNADKDAVLNVGAAASRATEVAEAKAVLAGYNYGVVNNYSVIDAAGFTNKPAEEKNGSEDTGYEYDVVAKEWNGTPTVKNFATFNAKGSVANKGLFENHNVLTSNFVGNAEFANTGILDIKTGAETYIDLNSNADGTADGTIILAELTPAKGLTIYKARKNADFNPAAANFKYRGTIKHTLAGKTTEALDLSASPVNYLVANADVEIGKTYTWTDSSTSPATTRIYPLETLEVTDGIVTLAARTGAGTPASPYVYPAQVANLIVNGEVEIDGEMYSPMVEKLTVNAGGVFGVPAESLFQILLADITIAAADDEAELAEGKVSVVGTLVLEDELAQGETGTTWPLTGGYDNTKYDRGDFGDKNIEINKDAEVKCVTGDAAEDNRPVEKTYSTDEFNLYQISTDETWYTDKPEGGVYYVKVNNELNMTEHVYTTSAGVKKYNHDYDATLEGAEEVELSGSIKSLTDAMALSIKALKVTADATIQGSENLSILTTDKLTITEGKTLTIEGGWLIIDVTPALGQGCSAIKFETGACVNGVIAAKNSTTGEYLFWNASTNKWVKGDEAGNAYVNSTVSVIANATQADLVAAFNNPNVKEIVVSSQISLDANAVIDGKNKPVIYTGSDLLNDGVIKVTDGATIQNVTFESPNTQYDVNVVKGNVVINNCEFIVPSEIEGKAKRGIYSVGSETVSLTVTGCTFNDEGYAFNSSNPNLTATFTDCELNGWMSGKGTYTFKNCDFGASGDYADFIPYGNATFNGCDFSEKFKVSLLASEGKTLTFENCNVNEVAMTKMSQMAWSYNGDDDLEVSDVTTIVVKVAGDDDLIRYFRVKEGDTKSMELTTSMFVERCSATEN